MSGATSLAAIANGLNERGVKSASGGKWHRSAVRNLLARVKSCEIQTLFVGGNITRLSLVSSPRQSLKVEYSEVYRSRVRVIVVGIHGMPSRRTSSSAAKTQTAALIRRLGMRNRVQAALFAVRNGIVGLD